MRNNKKLKGTEYGEAEKGIYCIVGNFHEAKSSWIQVLKKRFLWVNFFAESGATSTSPRRYKFVIHIALIKHILI